MVMVMMTMMMMTHVCVTFYLFYVTRPRFARCSICLAADERRGFVFWGNVILEVQEIRTRPSFS